jgi:hypothetical protein
VTIAQEWRTFGICLVRPSPEPPDGPYQSLTAAGWIWAFAAATNSPAARQHYRRRRQHGERHGAATRHLFNKLLGQLYHCLQRQQRFDEAKAFPLPPRNAAA